jgi:phosphoserine phosphatase
MIEELSNFPDNVLAFACKGHVTKGDYDAVVVPAVMNVLKRQDKIRLYYETAADFTGYDPGAIWEDFKVGMEHLTRWERVAVVTDVEWIKQTMRFFSFLMPGAMKVFATSEATQARAWIITAG